jgi:N-formylglutamate amidohydrolase
LICWQLHESNNPNNPIVAAAIHDGHNLRPEVAEIMALTEAERLREEDPFTGKLTMIAKTRIIGVNSRFEVDLNRARHKAIYLEPADAWGLQVWKTDPSPEIIARSLAEYDAFYAEVERLFTNLAEQFGKFVVFDLHTYNYRRKGVNSPADPLLNPEVNIGTGAMNRDRWAPVVDSFIADLSAFDFLGRQLDVRENIRFRGGHFSRWIHQTFPNTGCALAIEFKKFFMDEWTSEPDKVQLKAIYQALASTVPGIVEALA